MRDQNEQPLTAAEAKVREALQALRPPRADAAFRERLKADFCSGAIAEAEPRGALRDAGGPATARTMPFPRAVRRGFFGRPWAWIPAAAALAASLVFAVGILNGTSDWDAVRVSGAREVLVDGKPVPLEATEEFCKHLTPGARLEVPAGAEVSLICGNQVGMLLRGGTVVSMPAPPGRWFGRTVEMSVHKGEVHFTTGRGFHGARLAVVTPEARAEVVGATLAVICHETGTCVCVYDGAVNVAPQGGGGTMVQSGLRRFVYRDRRPPEILAILDSEREELSRYHDEMSGKLE